MLIRRHPLSMRPHDNEHGCFCGSAGQSRLAARLCRRLNRSGWAEQQSAAVTKPRIIDELKGRCPGFDRWLVNIATTPWPHAL